MLTRNFLSALFVSVVAIPAAFAGSVQPGAQSAFTEASFTAGADGPSFPALRLAQANVTGVAPGRSGPTDIEQHGPFSSPDGHASTAAQAANISSRTRDEVRAELKRMGAAGNLIWTGTPTTPY